MSAKKQFAVDSVDDRFLVYDTETGDVYANAKTRRSAEGIARVFNMYGQEKGQEMLDASQAA